MDENKQAMIEADEFDMDTMMVMFNELRAKQIRAEAEGEDALSPEMRRFIEEAKASGVTRCPIRDIEEKVDKCPVDFEDGDAGGGEGGGGAVHAAGGAGRERAEGDDECGSRPTPAQALLAGRASRRPPSSCRTSSPGT